MYTSVILFVLLAESMHGGTFFFSRNQPNNRLDIFPWVGVLKVQQGNTEALARLIIIGYHKAIGNANEISKLDMATLRYAVWTFGSDQKSSTAIFFEDNTPWNCNVTDYSLHPEFHDSKKPNTIALVNMDCERRNWLPIRLPANNINTTRAYAIGLIDHKNKELEQSMIKMALVNESTCKYFYKKEGLDFPKYWPKHLLCYKAADIKRRCVFDSGMALAVKHQRNWILTGLGILGPGCALPSRYIQIQPYVPWLKYHLQGKKQNFRRQYMMRKSRRTAIDPSKDIVSDLHGNEHDFYVDKLSDSTMALRPIYANVREEAYGTCLFNTGGVMYRDAGIVQAQHLAGIGAYALSLYDLRIFHITCVMVTVKCKSKSITKFWYEKGFRSDDFAQFIKVVPHPKKERGKVPPKVLFLTDHYHQYDNITTANIVFKFEFQNEATINVDFYGDLVTTTEASTTTTKKKVTRRTFPRHLYSTIRI